jgi:hypothetical protein
MLFMALGPAQAQRRCPAGQDQFLNCLSMNPQMRASQEQWARGGAQRAGNRYLDCIRNRTADKIRQGDRRALASVEETRRRGSAIGTPAFQSLLRENERACGGKR